MLIVDQSTLNRTTECRNAFQCMEQDSSQRCRVIACVNDDQLLIVCDGDDHMSCPYQADADGHPLCKCPVRLKLFTKYHV